MTLRKLLFQLHLWVGLSLGLLFIVIGLSGAGLMFRSVPGIGQQVSDIRATAQGTPRAPEALVQAARQSTDTPRGASATLILPQKPGDPAAVRFAQPQGGPAEGAPRRADAAPPARAPQAPDILVDPVSGKVLGTRMAGMTPVMQFLHDLHGQLLMGRNGRLVVGWLGVGMTFLGLSGLYLWWPRKGQWKNAFIVRRKATGARFYRELHGAVGIWFFAVFIVVSFTSVAIVFPQAVRAGASLFTGGDSAPPAPAQQRIARAPHVEPGDTAIDANAAIALVRKFNPSQTVQSVTFPARRNQALTITVGEGRGMPLFVDQYRAFVIAGPQAPAQTSLDKIMAAMRPLHQGGGVGPVLGPVYWVLVMLSGFLPMLFVVTGLTMWVKKRRRRLPSFVPVAKGVTT